MRLKATQYEWSNRRSEGAWRYGDLFEQLYQSWPDCFCPSWCLRKINTFKVKPLSLTVHYLKKHIIVKTTNYKNVIVLTCYMIKSTHFLLLVLFVYDNFSTVQFSHPGVSDSLRPHGLQDARPPCPSPYPRICPHSCPLHWWCHPAISSSDALFSFCPQSFPPSGTFPVSCLLASGWKVVVESCKDAGILGLWRRWIQSGARDEAWLLRAFV